METRGGPVMQWQELPSWAVPTVLCKWNSERRFDDMGVSEPVPVAKDVKMRAQKSVLWKEPRGMAGQPFAST